ncbi:hypothetical protein M378DRAFT_75165, partial [Amanita muscaria Koide BX008]
PPKGAGRKKGTASDGSATPHLPTLAEQLSYGHLPRPFKNPYYNKNVNRRAKNLKAVLSQEREREKAERERRRLLKQGKAEAEGQMELDSTGGAEDRALAMDEEEDVPTYTAIEAPPSVWPPRHYCDITGLEAPYTDPATGLRFYDKSVYQLIKGLSTSTAKEYLSGIHRRFHWSFFDADLVIARGVSTVVK